MSTTHAAPAADTEHNITVGDLVAAGRTSITPEQFRAALDAAGIRADLADALTEQTQQEVERGGRTPTELDARLAIAIAADQQQYPPIADALPCPSWCESGDLRAHRRWTAYDASRRLPAAPTAAGTSPTASTRAATARRTSSASTS